ncbi:cytochrome P450 [Tumebacillus permanentifrigoris]|uniref:Cytochrome P450 n=1 Tax=Tumebacillus permanentifrigoris TaxID=378543 RepID=A0A316DWJ1_9BACL|nr:cytochrome P450 [Tumebacillus permanentifrigoris]PWK13934.1 cytochrome P450 [Tumebacillus permanentifrigoris]
MTTPQPKVLREPPGPVTRSILGNLNEFRRDPHALMISAWQQYGDFVRFRFGNVNAYLPAHPDYIKHVLVDNHKNYARGRLYKTFERFFGKGLLTNEGESWMKNRRMLQPEFQQEAVLQHTQIITESATAMLENWRVKADRDEVVDGHKEMVGLVLRQLGRSVFSLDLSSYADEVVPIIQAGVSTIIRDIGSANELTPKWLPTPYNKRTRQINQAIHSIINRVIEEHKQGLHGDNDLVSLLLKEQAENNLNQRQVFDEVTTVFLAGHDTTAAAFAWLLYILGSRPDVRERLEEEVERVLSGRIPTAEDVNLLLYTRMVVMETLRLYPPVWGFPRDAIADDEIGGFQIKGGSSMIVSPYVVHRHPEFWDSPMSFNPERFRSGWDKTQHRHAYIPFGHGPRQCIGMGFALQQMMLSLPMIVQQFRVELVPTTEVVPATTAIMHPHGGLRIKIKHRDRG